jgi:hypothetical protein
LGRHRASCRQAAGLSRLSGCVRLPKAFAEKLYGITQVGTPVIIAGDHTQPAAVVDPGLLLGAQAKQELAKVAKKTKPAFAKSDAVTSVLVSSADSTIYVIQNGDIVAEGKATIADPRKPRGEAKHLDRGARHPAAECARSDRGAHEARHGVRHHGRARDARYALGQGFRGDGRGRQVRGGADSAWPRFTNARFA